MRCPSAARFRCERLGNEVTGRSAAARRPVNRRARAKLRLTESLGGVPQRCSGNKEVMRPLVERAHPLREVHNRRWYCHMQGN